MTFSLSQIARAADGDLSISKSFTVPYVEISGLSIAGDSLYLASDREHDLLSIPLNVDDVGKFTTKSSTRVSLTMPWAFSGQSQWEAVVVNNNAGAFLLNENESRIYHFDQNGNSVRTYEMEQWSGRKNASKGFEGMALMANSHFLIALESDPPTLLEYGPAGDKAQGFNASSAALLSPDDNFVAPNVSKLVPLAAWSWKTGAGSCQFSDLARAADGGLLILMKVCMQVGHVAEVKVDKTTFKTTATWNVPSTVDHPEGMQAISDKGVILSSDLQTESTNLYYLKFPGK